MLAATALSQTEQHGPVPVLFPVGAHAPAPQCPAAHPAHLVLLFSYPPGLGSFFWAASSPCGTGLGELLQDPPARDPLLAPTCAWSLMGGHRDTISGPDTVRVAVCGFAPPLRSWVSPVLRSSFCPREAGNPRFVVLPVLTHSALLAVSYAAPYCDPEPAMTAQPKSPILPVRMWRSLSPPGLPLPLSVQRAGTCSHPPPEDYDPEEAASLLARYPDPGHPGGPPGQRGRGDAGGLL